MGIYGSGQKQGSQLIFHCFIPMVLFTHERFGVFWEIFLVCELGADSLFLKQKIKWIHFIHFCEKANSGYKRLGSVRSLPGKSCIIKTKVSTLDMKK